MKGFNNMGNTCYLNAGLQMLIQNIDLCNLILKYSQQSIILNKIGAVIEQYYKESGTITPADIKNIVEKRQQIFYGSSQQDSYEFVIFLLNIIEEEINKINVNSKEIQDIFGINMNVRVKCKYNTCLQINNTNEKNNFLILNSFHLSIV
jgi:uncharacterized UBP type Zn finger protein